MKPKFWNRLFLVFALICSLGVPVAVVINDQLYKEEEAKQVFFECKEGHALSSPEWELCAMQELKMRAFDIPELAKRFAISLAYMVGVFSLLYGLIRFVVWTSRWVLRGSE